MKSDDSLNPTPSDFPDPAAEPVLPRHKPIDLLSEDEDKLKSEDNLKFMPWGQDK